MRERFCALLDLQQPQKGDCIFVLQGDGIFRAAHAALLFKEGFAPHVAIVGGADNRAYGSFPSQEVVDEMVRRGVPKDAIHFESVAPHTRGEADRAMELARKNRWNSLVVVTSPHHQYRAFLTFVEALHDADLSLKLINAVAPLSWTERTPWGTRSELLHSEFDKIAEYQKKGDVASYEEGITYLESL